MLARLEEDLVEVMQSLRAVLGGCEYHESTTTDAKKAHLLACPGLRVEVKVRAQEVAQGPTPLGTLLVRGPCVNTRTRHTL